MTRRLAILAIAIAAGAVLALACGGGDDDESAVGEAALPAISAAQSGEVIDGAPEEDGSVAQSARTEEAQPAAADDAAIADEDAAEMVATIEYVVQAGDSLFVIARDFDTTVDALVELNALPDANDLDVGQVLLIPLAAEAETPEALAEEADGEAVAQPGTEGEEPAAPPGDQAGGSPSTIPQPGPDEVVEEVPERPEAFADFAAAALPWLHDRTSVDEILELFTVWGMPRVAGGDRLNLVDTDRDGLFSVVIVYTDPQSFATPAVGSNLVIYDPVPGRPERYQVAYDHNLAQGREATDITVLLVEDITGDSNRDITYIEQFCGVNTCTASLHTLVRDGDGYRDAVLAPVDIPTAQSFELSDQTGDGLPDITIVGGTFGTVGAEPQRAFRFVFSGAGGTVQQVSQTGLPSDWLVWAFLDASEAFKAGRWLRAIELYDRVITDTELDEWVNADAAMLIPLANLHTALAYGRLDRRFEGQPFTDAATEGEGLIAELAQLFSENDAAGLATAEGCAALNDALALRVGEWDAFWSQYGFAVPDFRAEQICPF